MRDDGVLIAMRRHARRVGRHYRTLRFVDGMNPMQARLVAESMANAEERREAEQANQFAVLAAAIAAHEVAE